MTVLNMDCRIGAPMFPASFDAVIADPPYGDTSLVWDRKLQGWLEAVAVALKPNAHLWIFGSMRFLAPLFAEVEALGFKYSQDIVWEKQNGTGFHNDRFRRVHEHAVLFYRGAWGDTHHAAQFTLDGTKKRFGGKNGRRIGATSTKATT
jgi:site-specific DNA-methyltransferase (adenine-specific)